jgi:hypothetical protein
MTAGPRLVYRLLLAVDAERYSRRSARDQLCVQLDLHHALQAAAARSGLDRDQWYRQPRGDGELAVLTEETDIPHTVAMFTRGLEAVLTEINRDRAEERRLRIRMAFHYGTLTSGPFGPAGDAPVVVSRLLDSAALRRALERRRDRNLALIVSASLYEDIVSTGFCALDTAGFEPMRTSVKGIGYRGLVYNGDGHALESGASESGTSPAEDTLDTAVLPFPGTGRAKAPPADRLAPVSAGGRAIEATGPDHVDHEPGRRLRRPLPVRSAVPSPV